MSFSCKIILAGYQKDDGSRMVYLQAIIDRARAAVPLKFYLQEKYFDARGQRVRSSHPNADSYNKEFLKAIAEGNTIASNFRQEKKRLTAQAFKDEFQNPSGELDLIKFIKKELEIRKPLFAESTCKQHTTLINKIEKFRKSIRFVDINSQMVQEFKNFLIKKESNGSSTVNKLLKILKFYINEASGQGIKVANAFRTVKIKNFKSNRVGLSQAELDRLEKYFFSDICLPSHKKLLRYFLFSCYTGLRISDIGLITWNHIHDDILIFVPTKTKKNNLVTRVPLLERDKKFLPEFRVGNRPIFDTYAFPTSNEYLKRIAILLDIRKHITYHTSRHTFGSLFAEGGDIHALQKMMGHGSITTTMGYVHTSTKSLVEAKRRRYELDEDSKKSPEGL